MKLTRRMLVLPLHKDGKLINSPVAHLIRFAALLAIVCGAGTYAPAQTSRFQAGIDFVTLFPRGEFRDNVDNNGYGVGGQFLFRLGKSPFHVGVDAGFANYGTETRQEPVSETIPDVELEVRTTNNIGWLHGLVRAQPRTGKVRPYIDGLIGFKHFFTTTTIDSDVSEEPLASTTNFSDTALSYGVGGGVQIHLANTGPRSRLVFDAKLRYLWGGEAEYLKKGSIIRANGQVFFDVLRSNTNALSLQLGVTFHF